MHGTRIEREVEIYVINLANKTNLLENRTMDKIQILSMIHHREIPLESTESNCFSFHIGSISFGSSLYFTLSE
jgi:hypothetical protein